MQILLFFIIFVVCFHRYYCVPFQDSNPVTSSIITGKLPYVLECQFPHLENEANGI